MTQALTLYYTDKRKIVAPRQKVVMPCNHLLWCLRTGRKEGQHLDLTAAPIVNFLSRPHLAPRQDQFCNSVCSFTSGLLRTSFVNH